MVQINRKNRLKLDGRSASPNGNRVTFSAGRNGPSTSSCVFTITRRKTVVYIFQSPKLWAPIEKPIARKPQPSEKEDHIFIV